MSHDIGLIKDRQCDFLSRVGVSRWRNVPKDWREEFREALSDSLVTVGWGGVIELTDAGKQRLTEWR